jgi:hypothetical protein
MLKKEIVGETKSMSFEIKNILLEWTKRLFIILFMNLKLEDLVHLKKNFDANQANKRLKFDTFSTSRSNFRCFFGKSFTF